MIPPFGKDPTEALASLQELLDGGACVAVVGYNSEGVVSHFSSGAEALFQMKSSEAVLTRKAETFHDRGAFRDLLKIADSTGKPVDGNVWVTTGSGERALFHVCLKCVGRSGKPEETAYLAVYKDVSELHRAEKTIEELRVRTTQRTHQSEREAEFLRELLRHIIETVQLALAVTDLQSGMIAYVNEGFEELIGRERMGLIGNTLPEVLSDHPVTARMLAASIEKIRDKSAVESVGHRQLTFASGAKDVEVYGRTIAVEGVENQFVLLIIEDHTDRERLQTQLVQSEKLAAIGQLAAGIAHEIRNPLNTIFNALYDLDEIMADPSPEAKEDISISIEEIKRVQDIINNLLDFSRDSEASSDGSQLNEVLQKTIRLVQHDLDNRSIRVKLELEPVPLIRVSENSLKQILINLITNAGQSMEAGGVVYVDTASIRKKGPPPKPVTSRLRDSAEKAEKRKAQEIPDTPSTFVESDWVRLRITDTGIGISPGVLPNIFNPFFTTKDPGAGTGLGLSVVHSLLRDCGGMIDVESREGRGTTFVIDFPTVSPDG